MVGGAMMIMNGGAVAGGRTATTTGGTFALGGLPNVSGGSARGGSAIILGGGIVGGAAVGGRGGSGTAVASGGSIFGTGGTVGRDAGMGGSPIGRDAGSDVRDAGRDAGFGGTQATGGRPGTGGVPATGGVACAGIGPNEELIDDLNDGDRFIPAVNGRVGAWSDSHDSSPNGAMYPDPNTGFVPTLTGDPCRQYVAYVKETGYALWGASFWFTLGSPYNASKYTGVSFWAKADAGTSSVIRISFPDKDTQPDGNICQSNIASGPTACFDHYGARLTLTPTWTKYTMTFAQLAQEGWGHAGTAFDPASLYQVLFQIPVSATASVSIDDVAFTLGGVTTLPAPPLPL
jgi:hypothetical protein